MPRRPTTPRDLQRWARRGTTTQRGLGTDHQRRRRQLLPIWLGQPCPIGGPKCDGIMTDPKRMDLDHRTPRALGGTRGDRMACVPCNRGAGAALGNRMRASGRPPMAAPTPTRTPLPRW